MEFRFVPVYILLCFHMCGFSQYIPNGDFENWLQDSSGQIYLKNWEPQNGPEFPLFSQAKGYKGQFAVCLVVAWDDFLKKYSGSVISNNFFITPPAKYLKVSGYLKGSSGNTDTLSCSIKMFKGMELIGSGTEKLFTTIENWTPFQIPIQYPINKIPDRASITFLINTTNGNHKLTSYFIDSLSLSLYQKNKHINQKN